MSEFKEGDLVIASASADFLNVVEGTIDAIIKDGESYEQTKLRTGKEYPSRSEMLQFNSYMVRYNEPGKTGESLLITPYVKARYNKAQLYGLIKQLKNLINNDGETAAAMRSVADLYGKKDEVLNELDQLHEAVRVWDV